MNCGHEARLRTIAVAAILFSLASSSARGQPSDPQPKDQVLPPVVVAALITAGVAVVGGTIAWINDQSDDVQAFGVAVSTSPDFVACGGGKEANLEQDKGFSNATCDAYVGIRDHRNATGYAEAIPLANEPFIGKNTMQPVGYAQSSRVAHWTGDSHHSYAESKVVIDEDVRATRTAGIDASDTGDVLAFVSVDSLKIQVYDGSSTSSEWHVDYVANGTQIFTSHCVLNSKGDIAVSGDIPKSQITVTEDGNGLWTAEVSSIYKEVKLGSLPNIGDSMDVNMKPSTVLTGRDAFNSSDIDVSNVWSGAKGGSCDSGWVITFPTGSSDCFDQTYAVSAGIGNTQDGNVADGLPIAGVGVSVADFGSGRTYARVGVFNSNLALDPVGETPDLSSAVTSVSSPSMSAPALFHFVNFLSTEGLIPPGSTRTHTVVQLPPGDSGLLGVGADSGSTGTTGGLAGFTTDGYATPSIAMSFLDLGMNVGQDNSATISCRQSDRKPHGRLRASNLRQGMGEGDHLTTRVTGGDTLNLAFFGTTAGDRFRLYFNVSPCTPAVAMGPVLPTLPDPDGDGSYLRVNATWPSGYGGQTFRFSAVWGNPACTNPGVGFTNCVTIITLSDSNFGVCDDGTVETGWVVQVPSASSDYFNNNFGSGIGKNGIVGLTISVLDFGTAAGSYPTSGVANANTGIDASGNTPDIGSPLATVSPFTFPAGSFETTSGLYTSHAVSVPGGALGSNIHGWVQLPPGDSGLLTVGGDTTANNGCSFFSLDGYASPAISFFVNWGIRVRTN